MKGRFHLWILSLVVLVLAATAGPASAQTGQRKVGGRVQTLPDVQRRLERGPNAVLFLGRSEVDRQICEIFLATYQSTFALDSQKLIFFTRRSDYMKPAIDCGKLKEAYDVGILNELDDDLQITQFRPTRVLMLVCRDARGTLMNKGFVVFDSADPDSIQGKFNAFEKHYRKGPGAWEDQQQLDRPFEVLTFLTGWIPGKNTPCR